MGIVEHARSALLVHAEMTAGYVFDASSVTADKKIVQHVKSEQKRFASENVDDTKYLELIRKGKGRYTAARQLGVDPVAVMRRLRIDVDFADRVRVAEAEALEPAVETAHRLAKSGEKWALTFLLERKNADEFGEPAKKISIDHRHEHRHELSLNNVTDPIDREILELEADLRQQRDVRALNAATDDVVDAESWEVEDGSGD